MRTTKSLLAALAALALSATAVFAALGPPDAAKPGLDRASEASGKTVPVRPAAVPDLDVVPPTPVDDPEDAADQPTTHGATVSDAARGETPDEFDTHGAYVSSVARDNHGQETAEGARPDGAGKPDEAGKPDGAGKPVTPGKPATAGPPEGAGKP